jgi:D-alanyl-lipoteichoic acid acyltransferase DltB (MBOAT superfamily)
MLGGSLVHLPLFALVIIWTYAYGILLERRPRRNRLALAIGIIVAFLPLAICKYLPFLLGQMMPDLPWFIEDITLPIGISFFTFQAVSYLIDVYRKRQAAERDFIVYSLFLSFFPQLVAGPIIRVPQLIPQLKERRVFSYQNAAAGLRLMALGLFLKVFVADILATIVDRAYGSVTDSSALFLLIATIFFGIQIYCDFNGYTIIARGVAKVLGVELVENFRQPYLSTSISGFWRRWHISLTSWFMDYAYFPLGGSRCSKIRTSLNLLVTFAVSGIWHGAGWTFPVWGLLNGVYLVIEKALGLAQKTKSGFQALIGWVYTCFLSGFLGYFLERLILLRPS